MSRTAILLRERAELQKALARIDSQIADEAEGANDTTEPTEIERAAARRAIERIHAKRGR